MSSVVEYMQFIYPLPALSFIFPFYREKIAHPLLYCTCSAYPQCDSFYLIEWIQMDETQDNISKSQLKNKLPKSSGSLLPL